MNTKEFKRRVATLNLTSASCAMCGRPFTLKKARS